MIKKIGIVLASILAGFLLILYIGFLFVLPNVVDLNQYKPMVQSLVKEQIPLNVDFKNAKITTTPMLSIGVKADDISIKFEDGTYLFKADNAKFRVALPSILALTVKVSTAEVNNPDLNFTIVDGKQFKILTLVEKILQAQEDNFEDKQNVENELPFDTSIIRIKVPNVRINNYNVKITDEKTGHLLKLHGEKLNAGYFNGKVVKLKTVAELYSDENKNVNADIDINTFLPKFEGLDEEDDKPQRIELPFINPVLAYRQYDLKSNVAAKLKVRENDGLIKLKGFVNIDDTTLKLSNYKLPACYFHGIFNGSNAQIDTNFQVAKNESFSLKGFVDYGKNPKIDMALSSTKIYFQDLLTIAKAYLDSLHVKNDLHLIKGLGYIEANANIKSDLKTMQSDGKIIVRNGGIINKLLNLGITKINANLLFADNKLSIKDTYAYINNAPLKIEGKIDENSVSDIHINAVKIPIVGLFKAFAPNDIKSSISVDNGFLTIKGDVTGQLKSIICNAKIDLANFLLRDKTNSLRVTNNNLNIVVNIDSITKVNKVDINNKDLNILFPKVNSTIKDKVLSVNIIGTQLTLKPTDVLINNNSKITFDGLIDTDRENPVFKIKGLGKLNSLDLKKFAGTQASPFIDAKGQIPLELNVDGNMKRQNLVLRLLASPQNYITPVKLEQTFNKNSLLQAKVDFKGNRLKIKETGLFVRTTSTDEEGNVVENLDEIAGVSGTITNLNSVPFINIIKVDLPKGLTGSIQGFRNSNFNATGKLFVYGNSAEPRIRGKITVDKFFIRDLMTTMEALTLDFKAHLLSVGVKNLMVNGSDINSSLDVSLLPSNITHITNLRVNSNKIDVDKLLLVATTASRMVPAGKSGSSVAPAPIPVSVRNSSINLRNIKSGNIQIYDTNARIALNRSIFYINNLRTRAFKGNVYGRISMNLLNNILRVHVNGNNLDTNKLLIDTANMKDMLSGKLAFNIDISINAAETNFNQQMKSLKGTVNFNIKDGQFGPFGKLENLILAENIRESQFFQTAIGGILSDLTSIDTTHFKELKGTLSFKNGIATIKPITSDGKVLNLYLAGDFNLLENTVDMKVRARMLSMLSNVLGPIASINPVNLVKVTPGLNVASAKLFTIFTESITPDELNKIPAFSSKVDNINSTNFQIVVKGDVNKPLKLVKSFKWLALQNQIDSASIFVSTLPEPDSMNATVEELEAKRIKEEKLGSKIKNVFFKKEQKEEAKQKQETQELMLKMQESSKSDGSI
ncbi:MAG: AsmA-like C-terminal region-containing protein [Candidatus Gastranaerophilaceae bacterium]